jgi:serine O-acetyltransferase
MSGIWDAVLADLHRCVSESETSKRRVLSTVWNEMGLQAVLLYRFGQWLCASWKRILLWPVLPFGWVMYALGALVVRRGYGIRLSLSADIGPGFWVGHFGGVEVVNCRLGERCSVGQQTKVGSAQDVEGPLVGNGVWIGAHARIMGPVRVGNGATIAPGARVTKNVPERALVVGDPGRVVFRGYDNTQILPRA